MQTARPAADTLRFLNEASLLLASSLEYEQTLNNVAGLLVPAFADWCTIDVLEPDGSINMVAVAHADPAKVEMAHELQRRYPSTVEAARWVTTPAPVLVPELTDEMLASTARDDAHLRILRALGLRSVIVVPLLARGRTLGAITLIHAEGQRRYDEADLPPIEELARMCAFAVDNARLYREAQHEIAERRRAEAEVERLNRDLKRRVEELQALLDVSPVGLAVAHDPTGRNIVPNPAFARMLGIPDERNVSKTSAESDALPFKILRGGVEVPPPELPMQYAAAHDVEIRGLEHEIVRDDGVRLTMLEYATPLHDESGRVRGVLGAFVDITALKQTEQALREESHTLETINRVNATLAAELDLNKLVQSVTDAGTELSGAEFGAFFYNVLNEEGEAYMLYALSGVPHEAFAGIPMPRNTAIFGPTFRGEGIIRLEDVTQDPRYGNNPPFAGMPEGHLPVRSYLAAPVTARSGDVLGGLFFGHSSPGVFTERAERIVTGIADQAAIAIENARLFHSARRELAERRRAEEQLKELNETLEQRVADRTTALAETNARLTAEVAERQRAEQALERTNTALLQSNRELQEFAYVASHDLREPLRKISSFADLLRQESSDRLDESGKRYLDRMQDAAIRMSGLISDLLSFSRIATQGQPFTPIDLNDVVAEVLSDLEVHIRDVKGTVEVGPLPTIEADATQMRQLFQNLIGNALKFHRKDVPPIVHVRAGDETGDGAGDGTDDGAYRLTVRDNGIGFEEKYLDRIFMPFQRLHGHNTYPGTGIGLAICRRIVERHHGDLTARSRPGEGTTFVVTLPVRHRAGT